MAGKRAPSAVEEYQKGLRDDWNVYVAASSIDIDGAHAFNPGDAVPASHVTRGVVRLDQVIARDDHDALGMLDGVQMSPAGSVADLPGAKDAPDPETLAEVQRVYGGGEQK